ncbi:hypothetical protein K443DRAFT_398424 [Laccaria amethystina LaAM-08-1]|uniref:Uncharacterized protein n=1 Tax=Laccaria amethystina LaAM-08-1 TaxID=1095629 RepID=A0A0C9Y9Q5_9AGAR|nr:hypothetical protein K443DRAFT_398424 [Laccaria amethystina LaAM-08-1]
MLIFLWVLFDVDFSYKGDRCCNVSDAPPLSDSSIYPPTYDVNLTSWRDALQGVSLKARLAVHSGRLPIGKEPLGLKSRTES